MNIFGTEEAFQHEGLLTRALQNDTFANAQRAGIAGIFGRGNSILSPPGTSQEQLAYALNVPWKPGQQSNASMLLRNYYQDYLAQQVANSKQQPLGQAFPNMLQPMKPTV